MRQRVLNTVAAMVVAMSAASTVGAQTAAASPPGSDGATFVAFTQLARGCDFNTNMHIGPTGVARATALVHSTGSEVIADVVLVTAIPNTPYDVRVIQMPRSSAGCNPGDPGVTGGVLMTDDAGAGGLSIHSPIVSGATGAWMFITRPGEFTQTPAEFYTSDFVVPI
ncbi:hypothetical protein [Mycolicibacterium moriokaense]|uniref:Secreted protein n=1 Tax=Mycolicibacterium moriokaense TaxID=39691 RepID=A0A318HKQ3_9MYCO|nr:hypothetical protein [Mycolicibacterium moriokaense]PXX11283.1 hypothetical protein C8E89_103372 [Mycolicibacterium moriokaense]